MEETVPFSSRDNTVNPVRKIFLTNTVMGTHAKSVNRRQQKDLPSWHQTCFLPAVAFAASTGVSEVNMANGMQKDWRELCVAVTNESNPAKLSSLVQELIEALDRGERSWRHPVSPSDPIAAREAD